MDEIKTIYKGFMTPPLGIATSGSFKGWLLAQHPDGQWVTLVDVGKEFKNSLERENHD